jgi:hypothetical protein
MSRSCSRLANESRPQFLTMLTEWEPPLVGLRLLRHEFVHACA